MNRWRVLITSPQLQRTIESHRSRLNESSIEVILPPVVQALGEEELIALMPGIDGIVVGDDPLTGRVLEAADQLRVISKWGVGIDNIDLRAAEEHHIRITNTPGAFGDDVADVVVGYLVLLARRLHQIDTKVRHGEWWKPEGVSLAGRRLGVIGLGDIGLGVARRATAMGMKVMGTEILADRAGRAAAIGVELVDLPSLLPAVDVLSLNCPLTADNRHMIDNTALDALKPGAWIINTARGALIKESALVTALADGRVGAAALDVFEEEPLPDTSRLRHFDNVILGSHNGSNTAEAVHRTSIRAIDNLLAGLLAAGSS